MNDNNISEEISGAIKMAEMHFINSVTTALKEILPDLSDTLLRNIAKNICGEIYGDYTEKILKSVKYAYKEPGLQTLLLQRIKETEEINKGQIPDINKNYWCATCGSHSHITDPKSGYCYICNTDNWEPEEDSKI